MYKKITDFVQSHANTKMSWWYETFKGVVEQAYELLSNEETIGDTLSEFAYTVQTGYPRYILNNFSVHDLEKFLNHPQIDSFFIVVQEGRDGELDYGLVYKNHSRKEHWCVSTVKEHKYLTSISLFEYITGKASIEEDYDEDYDCIPRILSDEEQDRHYLDEDIEAVEKKILLLRPKTGSFSNHKIKKKIAVYEAQKSSASEITSEFYIFKELLGQPEYLDQEMFRFIRDLMHKSLRCESSNDTAGNCKKISALFDDTFRTYRIGLLL